MQNDSPIISGRSEAETAEILGVKISTLRAWRCLGRGPRYRKNGRRVDYPDEFIREFQDAGVRTPEAADARRQRHALAIANGEAA